MKQSLERAFVCKELGDDHDTIGQKEDDASSGTTNDRVKDGDPRTDGGGVAPDARKPRSTPRKKRGSREGSKDATDNSVESLAASGMQQIAGESSGTETKSTEASAIQKTEEPFEGSVSVVDSLDTVHPPNTSEKKAAADDLIFLLGKSRVKDGMPDDLNGSGTSLTLADENARPSSGLGLILSNYNSDNDEAM